MSLVQKAQFLGVEKNGPSLDFCIWTKTRPDTLPGMSRVGWAGAVMLKNRREKKVVTDRRTHPLIELLGRD